MAKYTNPNANTVRVDLETEGVEVLDFDTTDIDPKVKHAAMLYGFQHALRNATAGKMEEPAKALAAMQARVKTWQNASWIVEGTAKAAVGLSDDERSKIIADVVVFARKAKGDARTPDEIIAAFNALSTERKTAALDSLKKVIDKRVKDAIRQKKVLAKSAASTPDF